MRLHVCSTNGGFLTCEHDPVFLRQHAMPLPRSHADQSRSKAWSNQAMGRIGGARRPSCSRAQNGRSISAKIAVGRYWLRSRQTVLAVGGPGHGVMQNGRRSTTSTDQFSLSLQPAIKSAAEDYQFLDQPHHNPGSHRLRLSLRWICQYTDFLPHSPAPTHHAREGNVYMSESKTRRFDTITTRRNRSRRQIVKRKYTSLKQVLVTCSTDQPKWNL
jgi:hypothetical protein